METDKRYYVITCNQKHVQTNRECSFVIRIVNRLTTANRLMQSIYDDANNKLKGKYGINYSNPKWLDESHEVLQITSDIVCGYVHSTTIETYSLTYELKKNIFSNKPWILE